MTHHETRPAPTSPAPLNRAASSARAAAAAILIAAGAPAFAAEPAMPAGAAPVQPVVVRAVATFGFDRATLRPGDRDALLADVAKMKDVTWQQITTTGHTDGIGSQAYNEKLSARRAQAVKSYLVAKGIDGSMVATEAKASAAPAAANDTPEGRAKNRRTEVEFRGVRPAGN